MLARTASLGLALLIASLCAHAAPDAIYFNAKVWTGESESDFAEALALEGERISAVGANAKVRALAGPETRQVDLVGKLVVPGFIDNHTHFVAASRALSAVNLRDAATPAEFTRRIVARAKERPGEWILLGNWDHELWGAQLPVRDWIDSGTGDTPVFVQRLDGHMGLANSAALKRAGIDENTPDPPGGTIVRDARGRPTGLLKDTAMERVFKVIPPATAAQVDEALQRGFAEALAHGVTQIHDMGDGDWDSLEAFRRAHAQARLGIRVYSFVPLADWARMAEFVRVNGRGDEWLRWGALKAFVDGSLGSTTAWFHEPYSDAPGTSGLVMGDLEALGRNIRDADRAGSHVAVHAIGDRANDWLLETFQRVAQENGSRDRRFRIEHAQHLTPAAIERFARLGVIPSMQPYHTIDDGRWAEKRIGAQRLKGTYAFRSLLDAKASLTFGSDWAVAPIDPLTGIDAAVTRRTIDGRHPQGWQPQEKISVDAAVRAYTASNAYAGFQENLLGRIAPGYLADFVVLSEDLFTMDPLRILDAKVLRTVIGGVERYTAQQATEQAGQRKDETKVEQSVRAVEPEVIAWRRDIHQHPELGNREVRTAKLVARHLQRLGLEVQTGIAHTGVTAFLKGGRAGPTIALRADMDALPVTEQTDVPFKSRVTTTFRGETVGVMHACGHDAHTAILMGVAQALTAMRAQLPGNVLFIFQPAEEGAPAGEEGGAALMLKQGLFDKHRPQAIFGLHVSSLLRVGEIGYRGGPMMAAADGYRILVRGKQSHGSRPWQGIDPIVAAAQIINSLQTVVSRRLDITADPAVVSVGAIKGGIRNNIIPDSVEMIGTIRTFTSAQRTQILDELQRIVQGTAAANGATAELSVDPGGYPVTSNDPALTRQMLPSLSGAPGVSEVKELSRVTGAEDFSFYAQRVPALFFFVGITPPEQDPLQAPPNHSGAFYVDERGIAVGLHALARVAVDYLQAAAQR